MYHGSEFDEMSETSLPSVKFEVRNSLTDLSLKILEAKCDLTSTPVEDIVKFTGLSAENIIALKNGADLSLEMIEELPDTDNE